MLGEEGCHVRSVCSAWPDHRLAHRDQVAEVDRAALIGHVSNHYDAPPTRRLRSAALNVGAPTRSSARSHRCDAVVEPVVWRDDHLGGTQGHEVLLVVLSTHHRYHIACPPSCDLYGRSPDAAVGAGDQDALAVVESADGYQAPPGGPEGAVQGCIHP